MVVMRIAWLSTTGDFQASVRSAIRSFLYFEKVKRFFCNFKKTHVIGLKNIEVEKVKKD
jgi:hypothetical protein